MNAAALRAGHPAPLLRKRACAAMAFGLRAVLVLAVLICAPLPAAGQAVKPQPSLPSPEILRQRDLERDAAINLSLAKKSIQDDAYYNAKVALNVWRISAIEAGNFDRRLYEELRKQLHDKSVRDNLRCIEVSIVQRDVAEATLCLKIYRLHSQEINTFDAKRYEELKTRIAGIRKKEK